MKKKVLTILCILTVVSVAVVLYGCGSRKPAHYDYLVTFNYNIDGLGLDDQAKIDYAEQYLGAMDGQVILHPVKPENETLYKESDFKEKQITGYAVMGWYYPVLDADGNVVREEDGSVKLGKEWNFMRDTVTEDVTLYARLQKKHLLALFFDGKVQTSMDFVEGARIQMDEFTGTPELDGHTFYDFFADEQMTQRFTFPFTMGSEDKTIYAKFIEGKNWKIIRTAQEFINGYSSSARLFIDEEVKELDFTGLTGFTSKLEFSGEINGNGCVLKNLSVTIKATQSEITNLGMFGKLRATSYIHDITFDDISITAQTGSSPKIIGVFAHSVEAGARLSRVTVRGTAQTAAGSEATLRLCTSGWENAVIDDCVFAIGGIVA